VIITLITTKIILIDWNPTSCSINQPIIIITAETQPSQLHHQGHGASSTWLVFSNFIDLAWTDGLAVGRILLRLGQGWLGVKSFHIFRLLYFRHKSALRGTLVGRWLRWVYSVGLSGIGINLFIGSIWRDCMQRTIMTIDKIYPFLFHLRHARFICVGDAVSLRKAKQRSYALLSRAGRFRSWVAKVIWSEDDLLEDISSHGRYNYHHLYRNKQHQIEMQREFFQFLTPAPAVRDKTRMRFM
jgi:hypothetical protein